MAGETSRGSEVLGPLLDIVRTSGPSTRRHLMAATGLSRSTVAQQVDALLERGLIRSSGEGPSTGGRPPSRFVFNYQAGAVLAADLGATHARLELSDLGGEALGERIGEVPIAQPPEAVLKWVEDQCSSMLAEAGI